MFASPMSSRASGVMVLPAPLSRGDKGPATGLDAAATYHEAPLLPPQGTFYPSTEEGDPEGDSPLDLGAAARDNAASQEPAMNRPEFTGGAAHSDLRAHQDYSGPPDTFNSRGFLDDDAFAPSRLGEASRLDAGPPIPDEREMAPRPPTHTFGGGVASLLSDDAVPAIGRRQPAEASSVPQGAAYLGAETSSASGRVSVQDGLGSEVFIDIGMDISFPVRLDNGRLHWTNDDVRETLWVRWRETDWMVVRRDEHRGELIWSCYCRHETSGALPESAELLGEATQMVGVRKNPVIIRNGFGREVQVMRDESFTFQVKPDSRAQIHWSCDWIVNSTTAPQHTDWVKVTRGADGSSITWAYYASALPEDETAAVNEEHPEPEKASRDDSQESFKVRSAGKFFPNARWECCAAFPCCCVHCPICFCILMVLLIVGLSGAFYNGVEVESDFNTFLEADSESNDVRAAFSAALNARSEDSRRLQAFSNSDALQRTLEEEMEARRLALSVDRNILHSILALNIIYEPKNGNALDPWFLREARDFEAKLRSGKKWRFLCRELVAPGLIELCDPGVSLPNILFSSVLERNASTTAQAHEVPEVDYYTGGAGTRPLPDQVLRLVASQLKDVEDIIYEEDVSWNFDVTPQYIRSFFEFNLACCSIRASFAERNKQIGYLKDEYKDFIAKELHPLLLEQAEKAENGDASFNVYWYGDEIDEYEIWKALTEDAQYAIGSVVFIMAYLTFHTWSPLLSFCSMFLAILAIPVALVTSSRLSGGNRVTGASMLSLFLIVGLGADVILVFISFWEQSKTKFDKEDYPARIKYVYMTAGISCLATSMTTAASFFANLASVLRPLREFGFFMGWCIMWAYIIIAVGLPGLLRINEALAARCCSCCNLQPRLSLPSRPSGISRDSNFSTATTTTRQPGQVSEVVGKAVDTILRPLRYALLACFILVPCIMAIWVSAQAQVAGELPDMFPEEHNQNKGAEVREYFEVVEAPLPTFEFTLCNFGKTAYPASLRFKQQNCQLNWCQLAADPEDVLGSNSEAGSSTCRCHPAQAPELTSGCTTITEEIVGEPHDINVEVRFVGRNTSIPDTFWSSGAWTDWVARAAAQANPSGAASYNVGAVSGLDGPYGELRTLVQEHWFSGELYTTQYYEAPATALRVYPTSAGSICPARQVCYCGAPMCSFWEDQPTTSVDAGDWSSMVVTAPSTKTSTDPEQRRLHDKHAVRGAHLPMNYFSRTMRHGQGRRLGEGYVDVSLVWGIAVLKGSPLLGSYDEDDIWDFDRSFNPAGPSAQRKMLQTCEKVSADQTLLIVNSFCWVQSFYTWMTRRGEQFPAREASFNTLVSDFARSAILANGARVEDYMWFDDSGKLIATFVSFDVNLGFSSTSSERALEQMKLWDNVVEDYGASAPIDAPNVFHTSRLWGRAEAERAIVDSTVLTLTIALACGFAGTVLFTRGNAVLSCFVVIAVFCVTICLAFFMVVLMGWELGAIEVLGLIVFAGYSITYSLHIVHKYDYNMESSSKGERDLETRRWIATRVALQSIAGAVIGSAITTLGSSFFLFFCTLQIFVKLASVLFAVTFFACAYAVVAIPVALMVMGPSGVCGCGCVKDMITRRIMKQDPFFEEETSQRDVQEEEAGADTRRSTASPSSSQYGAHSEVFMCPSRIEVCMREVQQSPSVPRLSVPTPVGRQASPGIAQAVAMASAPTGSNSNHPAEEQEFAYSNSAHGRMVASAAPVQSRRSTATTPTMIPAVPRPRPSKVTLPE